MTDSARLEFNKVPLVEELHRHLPFNAATPQLYEEHTTGSSSTHYPTKALEYVRELIGLPSTSLIVLTGDAGHGKTHLCRHVLQQGGLAADEALSRMVADGLGEKPINLPGCPRALRVVKDLSEFEPEPAARLLEELMNDSTSIGLVSANEGRLRAVVSFRPESLRPILHALDNAHQFGETAADRESRHIHVVDLNFQSVAPVDAGFLVHVLDAWTSDGRRWRACTTCAAKSQCHIAHNRERLSTTKDGDPTTWRDGLLMAVRIAEQSGYVLTFREALILASYLITGGKRCADVAGEVQSGNESKLSGYRIDKLFFGHPLPARESEQLGVLLRMRRHDPGRVPHRDIDDRVMRELEDEGRLGDSPWLGSSVIPRPGRQLRDEARKFREQFVARRRRAYFSDPQPGKAGTADRARRLGLHHYSDFEFVQGDDESPRKVVEIVGRVIAGLHVIQGIRPGATDDLYIVDPAFSRSGSHSSVIAAVIPKRELWLWGLHEFWKQIDPAPALLTRAVDWLDRIVVLARKHEDSVRRLLDLNVMQFELVLRAAEGTLFPRFHAADRRRLLDKLAVLAEASSATDARIRVIVEGTIRSVIPERDDSIVVTDGSS